MNKPINLASHDIYNIGFDNIDVDPAVYPDTVLDARTLHLKYEANSVPYIYCGHFLEHLSESDGRFVVKSCFDILQDYGTMLAIVPDYTKVDMNDIKTCEQVMLAAGAHKVLMNVERLKSYFKEAGFLSVFEIDVKSVAHCRFPNVVWQSAVIALKHPKPMWR